MCGGSDGMNKMIERIGEKRGMLSPDHVVCLWRSFAHSLLICGGCVVCGGLEELMNEWLEGPGGRRRARTLRGRGSALNARPTHKAYHSIGVSEEYGESAGRWPLTEIIRRARGVLGLGMPLEH